MEHSHSWTRPPLIGGGGGEVGPSKNRVTWGLPKILLESEDNPDILYYILVFQSFELTMQDSYPSLFSIKILYHLYISDP